VPEPAGDPCSGRRRRLTAVGAPLRYGVAHVLPGPASGWPTATFATNLVGALLLGVLLESLEMRLARLQQACYDVGEALAQEYFYSAPWVAWTDAGRLGSLVIEEGEV